MVNKENILQSLKDGKSGGMISNLSQLENSSEKELQQIQNSINNSNMFQLSQVDQDYMKFISSYIEWIILNKNANNSNGSNNLSLKLILSASEKIKILLGDMTSEHQYLIQVITYFISQVNSTYKISLQQAKRNNKDEKNILSDVEHHFQTWISLINKELKDKECAYKGALILRIYNIQLTIRFQKYDYPGCLSILKHTINYYPEIQFNTEKQQTVCLFPQTLQQQPKSQQIQYLYYLGRLQVFEQKYYIASQCLQKAFDMCQQDAFQQKRQILKYLIPINMQQGKFATVELITKYKLFEYMLLGLAIQEGNIHKLEQERDKYKKCWIKRSLYLFISQLEILTYRNLVKRVLNIMKDKKTENSFHIDINQFQIAFELSSKRTFHKDEVSCLLGSLFLPKTTISGQTFKYLNGFVHKTQNSAVVVFSPKDPCPKLKQI